MKLESTRPIGEAHNRGVIGRSSLYSVISAHSHKAIDTLIQLLNCSNDNVRLGAARVILDKCLPDVKAIELISDERPVEKLIIIKSGNGFIPAK